MISPHALPAAVPPQRSLLRTTAWLALIALLWGLGAAQALSVAFADYNRLPVPLLLVALLYVAGKAVGIAVETLFYWLWWNTAGARLRFGALALWIASASLLDVGAEMLRLLARDLPEQAPWMAPLIGVGILPDTIESWHPALRVAFGTTGLLTLGRIVLTAGGQARELGRRLVGPLVLTLAAFSASRLIVALFFDLLRGRSPLG